MTNKDNPTIGSNFEKKAKAFFESKGFILIKKFSIPIGIDEHKKNHAYDLGSSDPKIIVECKAHKWTKGGNSPSAKLSVWNEAMYFFSLAPVDFRKILFVLRSERAGVTLADYYIARFEHLIPKGLEIWEYDPKNRTANRKY